MRLFGLIAHPVGHSFSQKYFNEKFEKEGLTDCSYKLFDLENINDLPSLISSEPDLTGLNISIPYKEAILPFLDSISPQAEEIGAVNTVLIKRVESGSPLLHGFNSDYFGFKSSISPYLEQHQKALIFGSGGSSKTVSRVLDESGINYQVVSRKGPLTYKKLSKSLLRESTLLINTTPLGMWPDTDKYPELPYDAIGPDHLLFDLIYNPELTSFLMRGQMRGAQIKGGLEMLHLQAEKSWEIWNS